MLSLNAASPSEDLSFESIPEAQEVEELRLIENARIQSFECSEGQDRCLAHWKSPHWASNKVEKRFKVEERSDFGTFQTTRKFLPHLKSLSGRADFLVDEPKPTETPLLRGWSSDSLRFRMENNGGWLFIEKIPVDKIKRDCDFIECFWLLRPAPHRRSPTLKLQISSRLSEAFYWVTSFGSNVENVTFVLRAGKSQGVGFAFDDGFQKRQTYYYEPIF
jgi:hypothetical protein